jgi:hypothetical protein
MDPAACFCASLVRIRLSVPAAAYIVAPTGQGILFADLVDLADEDVSTLVLLFVAPEACLMIPTAVQLHLRSETRESQYPQPLLRDA